MSSSSLIPWFEQLLFGAKASCLLEPPPEVHFTVAKLQAERVDWREMARLGGLTMHRYQIQCDFDTLWDYLEKAPSGREPVLKTRSMTTFFNLLLAHLARRDAAAPPPSEASDAKTLEQMLVDPSTSGPYVTATFWGELARQWLNHRRPVPTALRPLADVDSREERMARLYDVTCHTRGQWLDPLSMHLVPEAEHVPAVHWQSGAHLEAFLRTKPRHALSQAVSRLVTQALHQFLAGQYPSCLDCKDETLHTFLQNVSVIHATVTEVHVTQPPPRVMDVFQRLLAVAQLDHLWERGSPDREEERRPATQLMHLTEELGLAERQNRLLLREVCRH